MVESQAEAETYLLGLGGNIGDVREAMRSVIEAFDHNSETKLGTVSRLYRTPPWGVTDQPDFLNCAISLHSTLSPPDVLELALTIERNLHRVRLERWGPRTIDIDILHWSGGSVDLPDLQVPHPRMTERAFVMVPLADIAPDLMINGERVSDIAKALDATGLSVAGDTNWYLVEGDQGFQS
jgi:2-amino-4-hydroxy-6-hydroxymethyldihydropteridine diphosphokinase